MPVVEEVSESRAIGGEAAGPFAGDEIVAVAGEATSNMDYDQVVQRILVTPRPLTLVFRSGHQRDLCWRGGNALVRL